MSAFEQRTGRRATALPRDEDGSVLILVVFALLGLIAIAALAIDLGVMYTARNESQNVADGAALAGAGILILSPGNATAARAEAKKFALENHVRGQPVTLQDEDIQVLLDEEKVRVWVRHCNGDCGDPGNVSVPRNNPIATFFARVVGIQTVDVVTMAAAQAWPAGGAECLIPIMLPDKWAENVSVDCPGGSDKGDCTQTFDGPTEPTSDDQYIPYCANDNCSQHNDTFTGWGPEDTGTQLVIKSATGGGDINQSWYFPWVPLDDDGTLDEPGGAAFRDRFTECMDGVFGFGTQVMTEPGGMVGPTKQGVQALIDQDPDISWGTGPGLNDNPSVGLPGCPTRDGSTCDFSSPRIRPMPMFDPTLAPDPGRKTIDITNFASVFIAGLQGNDVIAYFLGYGGVTAPPTSDGVDTPIKFLRLVE